MISVSEYRKITGDNETSIEKIEKRIKYIETFCRKIIKLELENYVQKNKKSNREI